MSAGVVLVVVVLDFHDASTKMLYVLAFVWIYNGCFQSTCECWRGGGGEGKRV